jgi:hypothetical protein
MARPSRPAGGVPRALAVRRPRQMGAVPQALSWPHGNLRVIDDLM